MPQHMGKVAPKNDNVALINLWQGAPHTTVLKRQFLPTGDFLAHGLRSVGMMLSCQDQLIVVNISSQPATSGKRIKPEIDTRHPGIGFRWRGTNYTYSLVSHPFASTSRIISGPADCHKLTAAICLRPLIFYSQRTDLDDRGITVMSFEIVTQQVDILPVNIGHALNHPV